MYALLLDNILHPSGLFLFAASECSSSVSMKRGTSKHSKSIPLGDVANSLVREANVLVARAMLLIRYAVSRDCVCLSTPCFT